MKKLDDTVKTMKSYLKELEKDFKEKTEGLDEEKLNQAKEALDKTKTAINNSISKLNESISEFKEDDKVDELLDKVKAKTLESVEYTKDKIENIINNDVDKTIDDIADSIMAEFDKVKDSDYLRKTTIILKDIDTRINEFLEKPEVQTAIKKAKVTTVNLAEKGVQGLKKALDVDSLKEKENKKED